jgi:pyruvate/2-oxoglutarate dehydrogenase complex dihydrolipoamide dehydrogenase (E3) component
VRTEVATRKVSLESLRKKDKVDVYLGTGKFISKNEIAVNTHTLKFVKACIATGSNPKVPCIPGLQGVKYYT